VIALSSKPECGLGSPTPSPSHGFAENVGNLKDAFGYPDDLDWKLKKGKKLASVEAEDPIAAATMFAGIASEGFVSETPRDNGYIRKMDDGAIVVLRVTTSSDGSPAVDLNIVGESHIRKIHFYKGDNNA
jgi:hypothetical protein